MTLRNFLKVITHKVITLKSLPSLESTKASIEIALQKNLPIDCDEISDSDINEAVF